jgi:hypothetical protein
MDDRATLESTGEHLFAVAKLRELGVGADYTAEQYVAAVKLGQGLGAGEAYAAKHLGAEPGGEDVEIVDDGRIVRDGMVRS